MPPGTQYPVTQTQWEHGWDVIVSRASDIDKTPTTPLHQLLMSVTGYIIKWCITIAQKICFICFESLYPSD